MSLYRRGTSAFEDIASTIDCQSVSGLIVSFLEVEKEEDMESMTRKMMMNREKFYGFVGLSGLDERETVFFIGKLFPSIFTEKFCKHIKMNVLN